MYMALNEEQAQEIRKMGISVIEFKNCIRKCISIFTYRSLKVLETARRAIEFLAERLSDFVDEVKLCIETIRDAYNYPVSRRYKFVKYLNKLGYDKRKMWVATRHTWLARSNC